MRGSTVAYLLSWFCGLGLRSIKVPEDGDYQMRGSTVAYLLSWFCGLGLRSIKVPEDEDDHGGFRRRSARTSVRPIDVLNALSGFCSSAAARARPARFSR